MKQFMNIFVSVILIVIIYIYLESNSYDVVYVKSNVDNKEYLVRNLKDKQNAADLLARIRGKLVKLVRYLKSNDIKYLSESLPESLKKNIEKSTLNLKADIDRLETNFHEDNLSESTPDHKYTSYSVNKGEKIVFCMRKKNQKETLESENIMMFVALHELSHVMTKSVGHTPEFWDNFRFLLKIAIKLKLYKNVDFNSDPQEYCGTKITDTPLKE